MTDVFECAHFETGKYARNKTFLDDVEYSHALDALVKGCADVLITDQNNGKLLLGKRKVEPQPDWWFIGGRMKAGDTPIEAAQRNVKRETTLNIAADRFKLVCYQSYLWQFRKQEPAGNGTADIAVVLTVALTPEEIAGMKMCVEEYEDIKWMEPTEVVNGDFHPGLRRAVSHLLSRDSFETLRAAVAHGADDATLAKLTREYFSEPHVTNAGHAYWGCQQDFRHPYNL